MRKSVADIANSNTMKLLARALRVAAFLAMPGLVTCASAFGSDTSPHPVTIVAQAGITAEEAAAMIQARTGGRILAVKTIRSQGRVVYRVKVLTSEGEIRIFHVDAATGAM